MMKALWKTGTIILLGLVSVLTHAGAKHVYKISTQISPQKAQSEELHQLPELTPQNLNIFKYLSKENPDEHYLIIEEKSSSQGDGKTQNTVSIYEPFPHFAPSEDNTLNALESALQTPSVLNELLIQTLRITRNIPGIAAKHPEESSKTNVITDSGDNFELHPSKVDVCSLTNLIKSNVNPTKDIPQVLRKFYFDLGSFEQVWPYRCITIPLMFMSHNEELLPTPLELWVVASKSGTLPVFIALSIDADNFIFALQEIDILVPDHLLKAGEDEQDIQEYSISFLPSTTDTDSHVEEEMKQDRAPDQMRTTTRPNLPVKSN